MCHLNVCLFATLRIERPGISAHAQRPAEERRASSSSKRGGGRGRMRANEIHPNGKKTERTMCNFINFLFAAIFVDQWILSCRLIGGKLFRRSRRVWLCDARSAPLAALPLSFAATFSGRSTTVKFGSTAAPIQLLGNNNNRNLSPSEFTNSTKLASARSSAANGMKVVVLMKIFA